LKALGEQPFAVGFLGGKRGSDLRNEMEARSIELDFVQVAPLTRLCVTVIDEANRTIAMYPGPSPWGLGFAYMLTHRYDEALKEVRERSEAHPDDAGLHYFMATLYKYKHMEKEALKELEIAMRLGGDAADIPEVEKAFASGGFRAISKRELVRLQEKAKTSYVSPLKIAEGYAELGDREQTIHYLQLAVKERAPQLVRVHINPEFDFVHSDPRFLELLAKIGLELPK